MSAPSPWSVAAPLQPACKGRRAQCQHRHPSGMPGATDQARQTKRDRPREFQMTTIETAPAEARAIDMDALMAFVGKFVGDLGATMAAGNVLLGERLGLYRSLAQEPGDARSLAAATGTDPRYGDECLRGQAAGGYVEYDAETATYSRTPEQAFALTAPRDRCSS